MVRPVDAPRPNPEPVSHRSLLSPLTPDEMHDLMQTPPIKTQREPNVIQLRKCPTCREWLQSGAVSCCGNAIPVKQ